MQQSVAVHYQIVFPAGVTPISTLEELPAVSPKRRILLISKTVARVFAYCRANAGSLFMVAWLPCLLATLCLVALTFLLFAGLGQPPSWLLSYGFDPRTWLSAIVVAPFSAMVFAFVLDRMAGAPERGNVVFRHGVENVRRLRFPGRFEISGRILLASVPLTVLALVCGFAIAGEMRLFSTILFATHDYTPSSDDIAPWTTAMSIFNLLLRGICLVLAYVLAGDFLWTGSFDPAGWWRALDGNRLRLVAVLFIVFAIVAILQYGVALAGGLLMVSTGGGSPSFANFLLMHFGLKLPFDLLHLVLSAAAVGTILGAFRPHREIR